MPSINLYFSVKIPSTTISTTSATTETTTQGEHTIFISNHAIMNIIIKN